MPCDGKTVQVPREDQIRMIRLREEILARGHEMMLIIERNLGRPAGSALAKFTVEPRGNSGESWVDIEVILENGDKEHGCHGEKDGVGICCNHPCPCEL